MVAVQLLIVVVTQIYTCDKTAQHSPHRHTHMRAHATGEIWVSTVNFMDVDSQVPGLDVKL